MAAHKQIDDICWNFLLGDLRANPKLMYNTEYDDGQKNLKLCLKNVPRELNENGVRNFCGQYGNIQSISRMSSSPFYYFVEYTNFA